MRFFSRGFDGVDTSSHYIPLRYFVYLVEGDLEDFLQNDMFAAFAPDDIFNARERLGARVKYTDDIS